MIKAITYSSKRFDLTLRFGFATCVYKYVECNWLWCFCVLNLNINGSFIYKLYSFTHLIYGRHPLSRNIFTVMSIIVGPSFLPLYAEAIVQNSPSSFFAALIASEDLYTNEVGDPMFDNISLAESFRLWVYSSPVIKCRYVRMNSLY